MSVLNELDEIFETVKDDNGEFKKLPVGTYSAGISSKTKFVEANSKGNPMVTVVLIIDGGPQDGEEHYEYFNLSNGTHTKIALSVFAQFANSIGVDTSKGIESTVNGVLDAVGTELVFELKENPKAKDFPKFKVLEVK